MREREKGGAGVSSVHVCIDMFRYKFNSAINIWFLFLAMNVSFLFFFFSDDCQIYFPDVCVTFQWLVGIELLLLFSFFLWREEGFCCCLLLPSQKIRGV